MYSVNNENINDNNESIDAVDAVGDAGAAGDTDVTGEAGEAGEAGAVSDASAAGVTGAAGAAGITGAAGATGTTGALDIAVSGGVSGGDANSGDATNSGNVANIGDAANICVAAADDAERDRLYISDEVITQIIMIATGKIAGISLPSAGVGDGIAGLLGMKGATRGVRIEADEKSVAVDITVIVDYGIRINEVAKTLQDEVRNDLDTMTGLFVSHVNVHVTSVNTTSAKEPLAGKSQRASRTPREAPLKEAPLKEAPPKDASPINAPPKDAPPKDASPKDAAPEDVPRDESAAQQADKTHVQQAE